MKLGLYFSPGGEPSLRDVETGEEVENVVLRQVEVSTNAIPVHTIGGESRYVSGMQEIRLDVQLFGVEPVVEEEREEEASPRDWPTIRTIRE